MLACALAALARVMSCAKGGSLATTAIRLHEGTEMKWNENQITKSSAKGYTRVGVEVGSLEGTLCVVFYILYHTFMLAVKYERVLSLVSVNIFFFIFYDCAFMFVCWAG